MMLVKNKIILVLEKCMVFLIGFVGFGMSGFGEEWLY